MRGVVAGFNMGSGHAIIEVAAPKALVGDNLQQTAELFKTHHVRLVTIKRKEALPFSKLFSSADAEVRRRKLRGVDLTEPFPPTMW